MIDLDFLVSLQPTSPLPLCLVTPLTQHAYCGGTGVEAQAPVLSMILYSSDIVM